MGRTTPDASLTGDRYTIRKGFVRDRYAVEDGNGDVVLRGRKKPFRLKEQIPFRDARGEKSFTVRAKTMLDVEGEYVLTEPPREPIAVLKKDVALMKHRWTVRHPRTEETMLVLDSGSVTIEGVRKLHPALSLIPHRYTITGPGVRRLGTMTEKLGVRSAYDLRLRDRGTVPTKILAASAVAVGVLDWS